MSESRPIVDGVPTLSTSQVALLFGVTSEAVRTSLAAQGGFEAGAWAPPPEWVRSGRRRLREAQAATGSASLSDALAYLDKGTRAT